MEQISRMSLGALGEDTAARLLTASGYRIITRNFRCRFGEIDIIALRNNCLHFIEVKTRQGIGLGRPCESVTARKQEHMRKSAVYFIRQLREQGISVPRVSFQVIEIVIEQIENAF